MRVLINEQTEKHLTKLLPWVKMALIIGGVFVLAACKSMHRGTDQSAINAANAAYESQVQAQGLGQQARFAEQEGLRTGQIISRRIYYFDYDRSVVRREDIRAIVANADYLIAHPAATVMLEGHTDPRGSREYNIGLGERRAKAVANILLRRGVNPAQIRIVSYGAEKLATPGHTQADFQLDRRVVLVYL